MKVFVVSYTYNNDKSYVDKIVSSEYKAKTICSDHNNRNKSPYSDAPYYTYEAFEIDEGLKSEMG